MNTRELAILAAVCLSGTAAGGTTWYVDDGTCPAPGSGSEPNPFCSIQAAIVAAADGDEIVVAPGTYEEAIDLLGKAIHLHSSDGAAGTTIDAHDLGTSAVRCVGGESPETVIEGFRITGGTGSDLAGFLAGGGMLIWDASPTVRACVFDSNTAELGGGIMTFSLTSDTTPTITGCDFLNNEARLNGAATGSGGGMYSVPNDDTRENAPVVIDCRFVGNIADDGGGGVWSHGTDATFTRCRFIENHAGISGGGIGNNAATNSVTYCLFDANTAGMYGGAMVNIEFASAPSSTTVTGCTFIHNDAPVGGAIRNRGGSVVTIANSILWGNQGWQIVDDTGSSSLVTYSDVEGGHAGEGNIDANPLCDPGGRPQAGSPCIDAGDNVAAPAEPAEDLDGDPRFVNDPCTLDTGNPDGVRPPVDMGAYEFEPPCPANTTCSGDVGFDDLLAVISAWGPCGGCAEDVDRSGDVGFGDLLDVVSSWGPCVEP
jgi:hypothetical protein